MRKESELRFDVSTVLRKAKHLPKPKVKGITINLPFLSVDLTASNDEGKIAREVLIRLRDKRVLVAFECCNNCIKNSLASIQEIRVMLVDKQVELSNENTALFLIFDLMLSGIRQFLTFTERYDPSYNREEYFSSLEVLRGHLLRCIEEIAKIGITSPNLSNRLDFNPKWEESLYLIHIKDGGEQPA